MSFDTHAMSFVLWGPGYLASYSTTSTCDAKATTIIIPTSSRPGTRLITRSLERKQGKRDRRQFVGGLDPWHVAPIPSPSGFSESVIGIDLELVAPLRQRIS